MKERMNSNSGPWAVICNICVYPAGWQATFLDPGSGGLDSGQFAVLGSDRRLKSCSGSMKVPPESELVLKRVPV